MNLLVLRVVVIFPQGHTAGKWQESNPRMTHIIAHALLLQEEHEQEYDYLYWERDKENFLCVYFGGSAHTNQFEEQTKTWAKTLVINPVHMARKVTFNFFYHSSLHEIMYQTQNLHRYLGDSWKEAPKEKDF